LEVAVTCMYYHFGQNIADDSHLILGDTAGNIRVLSFSSKEKGPFYYTLGMDVTQLTYKRLVLVRGHWNQFLTHTSIWQVMCYWTF